MPSAVSRGLSVAVATVLAAGGAAACSGAESSPMTGTAAQRDASPAATGAKDLPSKFTDQKLDWKKCPETGGDGLVGGELEPMPNGAQWQCATLKAPLDYADPDGETMDLALVRARTKASGEERLGSLLFNFGGPGGSGVSTLPPSGPEFAELHKRYDLVSFDPRGVGASSGVKCLDDEELDEYYQEAKTPTNEKEGRQAFRDQERYARACAENSGKVLPYVGTEYAARDMDLMRQVLGDEKLNYFGISYGTELGGVYATLFPDRVGRAVFDAVVDPSQTPEQSNLGQAKGFQLALTNYLKACEEDGEDGCPIADSPEDGERRISELLEQLEKKPLETADPAGRKLNGSLASSGIALALYSDDFWEVLTEGLQTAMDDGDGTMLLRLSDLLNGRSDDGSYDNSQASLTAIACADTKPRYSLEDVQDKLPEFEKASPVFGTMTAWSMSACHGWPVRGDKDHPEIDAEGSEKILLIGATGDPATPYEGTRKMAEALGEDVAVELTFEGEGHGAYNSGDRCVQKRVNTYLLEGKLPENGTTCKASGSGGRP
ncbi:alpha/beta hydrolase [Streptomyces sp. XM4193]|uniref:alpha/beta hydrolase n=1 Tax=Streptomyces sp. XM4193 TaxID=2929782 RepID=UPI001FFA7C91|nr:alpha/beta hydrolase [Streptomyces sp. XM4193]MCK1796072.1 alpha/beta hydrolase [Streptomyces sp. XM4193]